MGATTYTRSQPTHLHPSPAQINQLLKIRWWDWPEQKIIDNVKYLISDNIDEFLVRFSGEAEI